MNNKTVLLFTDCYPFYPGEEFIHNEIEYLSNGFKEVIILPFNSLSHRTEIPYENVKVDLFFAKKGFSLLTLFKNMVNPLPFIWPLEFNYRYIKNLIIYYISACLVKAYFKQLDWKQEDYKKAICYTYWFDNKTIGLAYAKKSYGFKLVTRAHRWDLYEYLYGFRFFPLRNWAIQKIDLIFPSTLDAYQHLKSKYTIENEKIVLNRYGIFLNNKLNPEKKSNEFILVSCSLIKPVKRIELIIETLYLLSKNPNNYIKWYHIGDGELKLKMINLAKMKLDKTNINYHFIGNLPNEKVYEFYENNHVDLFINVSSSEGSPVSIMEANSYGIPAMATDVGGTKELVTPKVGYLLKSNPMPKEIAEKIEQITCNLEALNNKRRSTYQSVVDKFNRDINYSEFCKKLKSLQ